MCCRALASLLFLTVLAEAPALAKKKAVEPPSFQKEISKQSRIDQALNRLTFGPRPGDAARVQSTGLKKWIDLQLHPNRIPENPLLVEKLKTLDSLSMSSQELVRNYPAPQMVRQIVNGGIPFPSDPDKRMMIQKMVARFERRQQTGQEPPAPDTSGLLTRDQMKILRTGAPQQRLAAFEAIPPDKQNEVITELPADVLQALYVAAPPELRRKFELAAGPPQVVARDLAEGKLLRAIYGNRQLEEVLTDFWFNHFNVYLDKGADRYLVTAYERDVIRPRVLGKFRDLLEATAKSPAMLFYLDNWQSVADRPDRARAGRRGLNENYGRELLELHTLGVDGGYTQKDVTEVARCFTGWTIRQPQMGGEFFFNPKAHDAGEKTVLGVKIRAGGGIEDGEKVLDLVSRSPATAQFISQKLAVRFVADDPPGSLVERMTQTFLKTDGDLRAVMKTMLDSKEFWSSAAYRVKVKSPLELVASAVRAVNGDVDFAFALNNQVTQLGEPLYRKQEPTGYSNSGKEWINSAGLLARMNFAINLANNRMPGVKVEANPAEGLALGAPEFQKH
ncbi:MAG TPA: DUF1800 domain-containing protein [Bryobacteraceae bacterium]|nr:DUF1800 domain-containing protein [Bryobacteraceae bacterium]